MRELRGILGGDGFTDVNEEGNEILDLAISSDPAIANTSTREKSTSSHIKVETEPIYKVITLCIDEQI